MPHRTSIIDDPNEAALRGVQALIEQSEGKEPRRRRARATRGPQGRQGPCGEAVCKEAIRHREKRGSGTLGPHKSRKVEPRSEAPEPRTRTRTTPAQAAGVTDRLWEIADIVSLLDAKSEVAA